jgi:hypothetical protein
MYQYQGMSSIDTTSPITSISSSSGSSISNGALSPYSASIQGSWHQNISPSSLSPNVPQAHTTPNPPWPSPISSPPQSLFPPSSVGPLSPAGMPTQETNLAWQRVPGGDAISVDAYNGYFSGRMDETDHQLHQSNVSFQAANSSHRYVIVLHSRRLQLS